MKYKVIKTDKGEVAIDEYGESVATINHSIGLDFPMVVVENEVHKLAEKANGYLFYSAKPLTLIGSRALAFNEGFIEGHKASQQKGGYSEEELIKYLEWIGEMGWYYEKENNQWVHDDELGSFKSTQDLVNHYKIQSLKHKYIELEMEWDCQLKPCVKENPNCVLPNDGVCKAKEIIKTDRLNGQLMAYVKNDKA